MAKTKKNVTDRVDVLGVCGDSDKVAVIAGVNLPMLVRLLNYPNLNLEQLVDKAMSGGQDGILLCCNGG